MDALVYDIEIVKGIPSGDKIEGIEYCKGWTDYSEMGVSIVGVYDYVEDCYRVFCSDNLQGFFDLADERKLLIGFNNIGFDNKVLNCQSEFRQDDDDGNTLDPMPKGSYYDILRELWRSAGGRRFKGSGLDNICVLNNLGSKSGHGAMAPVDWQRGNIGAVIDYCLNDVKMTKDLFDLCQSSTLESPIGKLTLRKVS